VDRPGKIFVGTGVFFLVLLVVIVVATVVSPADQGPPPAAVDSLRSGPTWGEHHDEWTRVPAMLTCAQWVGRCVASRHDVKRSLDERRSGGGN
jgi:hypothetical protein